MAHCYICDCSNTVPSEYTPDGKITKLSWDDVMQGYICEECLSETYVNLEEFPDEDTNP